MNLAIDKDTIRLKCLTGTVIKHQGHASKLENLTSWGHSLGDFDVIFNTIVDMAAKRQPITVTSLVTKVCSTIDVLDSNPWKLKIEECVKMAAPDSRRIDGMVKDVSDTMVRKEIKSLGNAVVSASSDVHSDTERLVDLLEQGVTKIRDSQGSEESMEIGKEADAILQSILDSRDGKQKPFIPTGFKTIDFFIKGFYDSKLYTIAARTKVGKSALSTSMAVSIAKRGIKVGIISLEMDKMAMTKRLAQHMSNINADDLHESFDQVKFEAVQSSFDDVKSLPIVISTPTNSRISNIKNLIRNMRYGGCRVIFVDYVQKVTGDNSKASKEQIVSAASDGLMNLAKELKLPIVQIAQLNRNAIDGPKIHHIKDSDQIALDSHVVMLLDRKLDSTVPLQEAEVVIAANRDGRMGKCPLTFIGSAIRYVDRMVTTGMANNMSHNDM